MNDFLFSSSSSLLCFVCNGPFKDPRLLPCQHSFCLKCIGFLCDSPTSNYTKKIKLVCPKCTTHFNVPSAGVESFPVNTKLTKLKSQIIDEVANNISNDIRSSRESLNKLPSTSPQYNMRSSRMSSSFQKDTNDSTRKNSANLNQNEFSSLKNDYSKYAKYFEETSEPPSFKPTIRADHARVSYESSTRFRNRQKSKDREKPNEKEYRRRTWYGSTLENRRAQSLSRTPTNTEKSRDPKSPENLCNISEDREHVFYPDKSSHRHSMYADYSKINITPTPSPQSTPTPTRPTQLNDPSKPSESLFSRRANLGGPSRPTLATHRENIVTEEGHRRSSKERKHSRFSPLRNESKFAYKARKNSPKVSKEKNRTSPSPSPRRSKVLKNGGASEKTFHEDRGKEKSAFKDGVAREGLNGERGGERMDRRQQFMKQQEEHQASKHHHDHSSSKHHHDHSSSKHHPRFKTDLQFDEPLLHKKARPRCRSMDARPKSLNKNDFTSASEFKSHLLGMTMKKERYEDIMQDFDFEELLEEEEKEDEEQEKDLDKDEDKENLHGEWRKADGLIDEDFITSLRAKYSSSLHTKKSPRHTSVLQLGEGVTEVWSYQKNDCGLPASAVFLPSHSLVVADYGQSCLEFLDSNGIFEHSITGIKPFGMAINRNTNCIVVGDRKGRSIRIFDEFGADVSQIDSFNSVEWLGGIGVKRDGCLVVCDRSKSRIMVCNSAGDCVREFGSYGLNPKQFCMADFLALDSKDRIVVADSGNHCIKIFDSSTGSLLKTVGGRGAGEGQFEWPKGLAIDDRDNILVADTLNRRVSMFSVDGCFIKHLVSSIPDPYNLSFYQGKLAILHHNLKGISSCDVYSLA